MLPDVDSFASPWSPQTGTVRDGCYRERLQTGWYLLLSSQQPSATLYIHTVSNDVWVGAITALIGTGVGGAISFILSPQQLKDARLQRQDEATQERQRRSEDRRFQAYSEYLTRARSHRNGVQAVLLTPRY